MSDGISQEEPPASTDEDRTARELILDLTVTLPTRMLLSVASEIPKLASRRRQQVSGEVGSARAVGEFVVKMGRSQLSRRLQSLLERTQNESNLDADDCD